MKPLKGFTLPQGGTIDLLTVFCGLVACNSDIGIAFMYHEACVKESFV